MDASELGNADFRDLFTASNDPIATEISIGAVLCFRTDLVKIRFVPQFSETSK